MVALIQHIKNDISVSVLKAPMIPWSIPWPINYKGHWNSGSGHWLSALKEYTTSHYRDTLLESKPELLRIFNSSFEVDRDKYEVLIIQHNDIIGDGHGRFRIHPKTSRIGQT